MSWFRRDAEKEQVPVAVAEVEVTPEPELPKLVKQDYCPDEEYATLYTKLGLGLNIASYPLQDVIKYLDRKFPSKHAYETHGWVWVPVRRKDIISNYSFNDTDRVYTKPIPFAVLKTIDEIQTAHPEAKFFISDERQPGDEKDPFLLVTIDPGRTRYVIERWDEPSFR